MKPNVVIIAGPTASGKSRIALECARHYNGEIISADSMQIYKNMSIGTAKPTKDELSEIKHHLIDIKLPSETFSVGEYSTCVRNCIEDVLSRKKIPIVVGGTGLYIKSLLFDYNFCNSQKNIDIRNKYLKILEDNGKEYLHNMLKELDSTAAEKIHQNDIKKVVRALEILETSGNKKSLQVADKENDKYNFIIFILNPNRELLYENINKRFEKMIKDGLIDEIKNLLNNCNLNSKSQSLQAIGYKEFLPYLNQEIDLQAAINLASKNTRNYAKRQITMFKGFKNGIWVQMPQDEHIIFEKLHNIFNENNN